MRLWPALSDRRRWTVFNGELGDVFIKIRSKSLVVPEGKMRYLRDQGYVSKRVIRGVRPENVHDELIFLEASQHPAFDEKVSV